MKTGPAFFLVMLLAGGAAWGVLRFTEPSPPPSNPQSRPTVLAGHPATLALAHALANHTPIDVVSGWPAGTPWTEQWEFARQPPEQWVALARIATAVVTLRHVAPEDALYASVRAVNPRIVEIDASVDSDQRTPVIRLRSSGATGPAFALSLGNATRLAERIAGDFTALSPADANAIAENLRVTKEALLRLRAKFDREYAAIAEPAVVAFTSEFDYLLEELGVQVALTIDRPSAEWNNEMRASLIEKLRRSDVRVSVHSHPPNAATAEVLLAASIRPLVLDPVSRAAVSPAVYVDTITENISRLKAALLE